MLLEIKNLQLDFATPGGSTRVLHGVDLHVERGEVVGLVGESGSGKSTTVRAALRLYPQSASCTGTVNVNGENVLTCGEDALHSVRSREVAMIHQDPRGSLNPVRRIGDSLTERLVHVLGVDKFAARAKGMELLRAVGLTQPEKRMRQYPHEFSGGMLQRVVIAAALSSEPQLILADEATSALDVTTQAEVLSVLREAQRSRGLGMLFITHDLHLAAAYCDRVYVMFKGRIVEELEGNNLFAAAREEYTRELLSAVPSLKGQRL
ncbi:ABC transporter ATP-binding protein [Arthrobacter sp. MYb211]|uniref:ABC transporter ATP-binding protein n=1 Tax=unclassified Arthrobacter TaxID=235627 RepID=UPI000CFA811E|nr:MULTISPECIES: ABC transporter ATP-binding protein [unclassified Arthrobacter]PRA13250.1 ABC transporter ATP-binding protein [Arthrobacter sp. MYb221]PRC10446.1 ABC transporter ATP-binding protein [Arthrobacter sp. MYb211]